MLDIHYLIYWLDGFRQNLRRCPRRRVTLSTGSRQSESSRYLTILNDFTRPTSNHIHFFTSDNTWELLNGRPTKIGPLLDSSFFHWVQNGLVTEILHDCPNDPVLIPNKVREEDIWLTPIIQNTLGYLQDNPHYEPVNLMHFYIGLERDFDCPETNCVMHSSWGFHVKQINSDDETIQGYYDNDCLTDVVEAWLESFFEVRFPRISFDYSSLIDEDSLPHIRL